MHCTPGRIVDGRGLTFTCSFFASSLSGNASQIKPNHLSVESLPPPLLVESPSPPPGDVPIVPERTKKAEPPNADQPTLLAPRVEAPPSLRSVSSEIRPSPPTALVQWPPCVLLSPAETPPSPQTLRSPTPHTSRSIEISPSEITSSIASQTEVAPVSRAMPVTASPSFLTVTNQGNNAFFLQMFSLIVLYRL